MKLINPALQEAGWNLELQVRREVAFAPGPLQVRGKLTKRGTPRRADYLLFVQDNLPIAVIEAKKKGLGPGQGMQQALGYAEALDVPFAISSDGTGFLLHDRTGRSDPREQLLGMDALPGPDALWARYRDAQGLSGEAERIARFPYYEDPQERKEPRYYQRTAIQRTVEAIARGERRALLVMATGTGKTYTAFQIIWRLWKAGRVKRVLFLADRNILIDQTRINDFKPFGPAMTKIANRTADHAYEIFLALYQAIVGGEERADLFREFSPDFFDLIVVDECHRGSAKETSAWRDVLDYFSGAIHLGLTATPKETKDVSTSTYFDEPLYTYSLRQGIEDGFLAPYKVIRVDLDRDVQGWRPTAGMKDDLGQEIEDREYNRKDMDKSLVLTQRSEVVARCVVDYLLDVDRHARTIVFCVDIDHAERMRQALVNEVSRRMPEEAKRIADFVVRITGDSDDGKRRLDDFIDPRKRYPVVATTSKLLSTGVDVKTCKLIVLDQEIESMIEFKQIVGRGTRIDEEHGKSWFAIMDFRGATAKFADPRFDGPPIVIYEPKPGEPIAPPDPDPPIELPGEPPIIDSDPIPEPGDPPNPILPPGAEPEPPRKYVVSGERVAVIGRRVQYLGPDGKLITEKLTDFTRRCVMGRYPELGAFLTAWSTAERKQAIVEELEAEGLILEELRADAAKIAGGDVDPFDLICQVAYDRPPLSRRDRARNVQKRDVFTKYGPEARRVIDALLEKYADEGIKAIEDPGVLRVAPFAEMGTPVQLVQVFGGRDGYLTAVRELESALYAAG